MEWHVTKAGAAMFDALHAYGLGIVAASSTSEPVAVQDCGCFYRLSCSGSAVPQVPDELLDEIFALPEPDEVLRAQEGQVPPVAPAPALANLDGLLAALFTRPDVVRSCSLSALLRRHRFNPSAIERGIESVRAVCAQWKAWVARETPPASHWLGELLGDYDSRRPRQPLPTANTREDELTATLALDPSLAYATRQALSDGRVGRKVNMTIRGTRFAVLLAYIGAMRFLRAQPVKGDYIAYSIPVAPAFTLQARSARPLLWPRDEDEPEEALLLQAFDLVNGSVWGEKRWKALLYQVLQVQGKQAAISRLRGALDVTRLALLESRPGEALPWYWRLLLRMPRRKRPYELDHLVSALVTGRHQEWEAHLCDVAQAELARWPREKTDAPAARLRLYSIDEVKEVSATMESPHPTPLSAILEGKNGTVRFGHALRQLRENAPSMGRDVLEDLESIKTREQLMDALMRAMQWCEVMEAKSPFMIIPTDPDLKLLLEDVERYGPQSIAALLRLLSTLHHAPRKGESDHAGNAHQPGASDEPATHEAPGDAEQM